MKWVPAWDNDPDSEIEFSATHNQPGSLDILLQHPNLRLGHMLLTILVDFVKLFYEFNLTASTQPAGFENPQILRSVNLVLWR